MPDSFFEKLNSEFDALAKVIGTGLLASYLLAVDQVKGETARNADFAEGDGPIRLGFDVEPQEAIDYFKNKKVVTRKTFDLLAEDARSSAFTVSGLYKSDVLKGFKDEISKALKEGTPQKAVIKRFKSIVSGAYKQKELGNFHLETVFRSNLSIAYNTGRRRALEEVAGDLPYWQYQAVMDDRTRPAHAALHGLILPANHEFWSTHFPPIGFNCRCTITALEGIPEGYNGSKPNGENNIFYNERGAPFRAEIGGSMHDLTPNQFSGIPQNPNLRSVIESRVKSGKFVLDQLRIKRGN